MESNAYRIDGDAQVNERTFFQYVHRYNNNKFVHFAFVGKIRENRIC